MFENKYEKKRIFIESFLLFKQLNTIILSWEKIVRETVIYV